MRTPLVLLLAVALVPLSSGSAVIDPRPICTYDLIAAAATPAAACVDVDLNPVCVHAWATVYERDVNTPGASAHFDGADVGPIHVSPFSVTVDSVWIVTVPQKGFTNDFCTTELLA